MSALIRHPWSQKFSSWLDNNQLEAHTTRYERAGGVSELLELGRFSESKRPTIFFLHGLGNDALFPNINFFRSLLLQGCNIVTSDLDGHGQDLSSLFAESTLTSLIADMISHSRIAQQPDNKIHVCGFSLGAVLALDFATRRPNMVQTISLIGMPLQLQGDARILTEMFSPLLPSYLAALKDYGLRGIQPALGPFLRRRYPVRLEPQERSSYLEVAGRIIRALDPAKMLQAVERPTLYLAGGLDFIGFSPATAKFLDGLRGSDLIKQIVFPRETHFSIMLAPKTPLMVADLLRNTR